MKVLAWDTSSIQGVVAAAEIVDGKTFVRAEWSLSLNAGQHSERLLWTIDQVLHAVGWTIQEMDFFIVGVGPGSFTGLRIGITTARTLSMILNKPVVPVSSLAVQAYPIVDLAQSLNKKWKVFVASDAAKGEIFGLAWRSRKPSSRKKTYTEALLSPEKFIRALEKASEKSGWVLLGNFEQRFAKFTLPTKNRVKLPQMQTEGLRASGLVALGMQKFYENQQISGLDLVPNYLRESDAEVKLKNGQLAPQKVIS